ncbi:MAG: sulfatase-like hydrolase/transferase [Planctomycetota bacterium]
MKIPLKLHPWLLAVLLVSCERGSPLEKLAEGQHPNVLLITLDTTRADFLGCYGDKAARTPTLDSLADSGLLFEHAYSPVPITLPAHCSILTGVTPLRHGVYVNGSFHLSRTHRTLAEILKQAGYQTAAVVGAFPLLARFGLNRGFDVYDDKFPYGRQAAVALRSNERSASLVVDVATKWLKGIKGDRPWFLWVHFFDPHDPYQPPQKFCTGKGERELYRGEIAYVDQQLGRLLNYLSSGENPEKTLVVVAGDHGEALGDHGEPTHSYYVYEQTVRVPLILSFPGQPPQRVSTPVSLVDVLPTITDLLGLAAPTAEGVSLLRVAKEPAAANRPIYMETRFPSYEYGFAPLYSVRAGGWKYIHAPIPELYNLAEDPQEKQNLARTEVARVESLRELLERMLAGVEVGEESFSVRDPELRERLASLGYARLGAPLSQSGAPRPDPKAMLELYLELRRATELGKDTKQLPRAITQLEAREEEFAHSIVYRVELGSMYYRSALVAASEKKPEEMLRRYRQAQEQFLKILEWQPDYVAANLNVGSIAYSLKNYPQAVTYLEKAIEFDSQTWQAYVPLCMSLLRTGGSSQRACQLLEDIQSLDAPTVEKKRAAEVLARLQKVRQSGTP